MNRKQSRTLCTLLPLLALGLPAAADPLVLDMRNPPVGVRENLIVSCLQAVHDSPALGHDVVLSHRVTEVAAGAGGRRVFVLNGWANEHRARTPIKVRCTLGNAGSVASVARIDANTVALER